MALSKEQVRIRARYAANRRWGHREDADQALTELKASRLADHIRRIVDSAPPLTTEQKQTLAALLRD